MKNWALSRARVEESKSNNKPCSNIHISVVIECFWLIEENSRRNNFNAILSLSVCARCLFLLIWRVHIWVWACESVNWSVKGKKVNDLCAFCHWKPFLKCMGSNGFFVRAIRRQRHRKVKRNSFSWFLVLFLLFFFLVRRGRQHIISGGRIRWDEKMKKKSSSLRRHILSTRFTDLLCHLLSQINGHKC